MLTEGSLIRCSPLADAGSTGAQGARTAFGRQNQAGALLCTSGPCGRFAGVRLAARDARHRLGSGLLSCGRRLPQAQTVSVRLSVPPLGAAVPWARCLHVGNFAQGLMSCLPLAQG